MGPAPSDAIPPRGWLRLMFDPLFGRYFLGRLLSSGGMWIHNVVAAVLAFQVSGSAFIVGLVSVAQFLPQLLFAPISGTMADRGDRRRQVIVGRLVVAAGSGSLALWLQFTDWGSGPDTAALLVSAAVVGIGFVTGGPAMHAMVPALVRPNEISAAVTLNSAPVTLSRAVGPVIGTAIALTAGPPTAFAIAGACNLAFAVMLLGLRVPPNKKSTGDRSMRPAFAFLRQDRTSAIVLAGVAAVGIAADPAITLAPSLSDRAGAGLALVGVFASAFGVGAGLGFLLIPALRRLIGLVRYGTAGFGAAAAGLVILVFSHHPAVSVIAFVVSGVGMTLALTSLSAQLQERLPEELRGRIMALWSMGFLGSRPLAAALDGAIADLVSVEAALIVVAATALVAMWFCRRRFLAAPETAKAW